MFIEEIIDFLANNSNCVVHVIAGIITPKLLEKLYNHNIKLLILGYKYLGRGEFYFSEKLTTLQKIADLLKHEVKSVWEFNQNSFTEKTRTVKKQKDF